MSDNTINPYDEAAQAVVELGNRMADTDPDVHVWDIADGLLAGAIQYWLYARQPCGDPRCEECDSVNTAARRLAQLLRDTQELAETSEYFHSPNDINVGRA